MLSSIYPFSGVIVAISRLSGRDRDGGPLHPRAIRWWFFLPPHSRSHLESFLYLL